MHLLIRAYLLLAKVLTQDQEIGKDNGTVSIDVAFCWRGIELPEVHGKDKKIFEPDSSIAIDIAVLRLLARLHFKGYAAGKAKVMN